MTWGKPIRPVNERFWEKVNKDGPTMPHMDSACWVWTAGCIGCGYGNFAISSGNTVLAHRYSYQLAHGDIVGRLFVCHRCDNRLCVRPDHLFLDTPLGNVTDMVAKGRYKNAESPEAEPKVVRIRPPKEERFWEKVDKDGPIMPHMTTQCWEWQAIVGSGGYGNFRVDKKMLPAHRVSYEFSYGAIPDGMFICHKCDNRRCVRPDHLFAGTQKDNALDRESKGRGIYPKGENSARAKLTNAQVMEIRARWEASPVKYGLIAKLSREFNICTQTIDRVVNYISYI